MSFHELTVNTSSGTRHSNSVGVYKEFLKLPKDLQDEIELARSIVSNGFESNQLHPVMGVAHRLIASFDIIKERLIRNQADSLDTVPYHEALIEDVEELSVAIQIALILFLAKKTSFKLYCVE